MAYFTLVNTTNTDAGTDSPRLARSDILDLMQKFNIVAKVQPYMASEYASLNAAVAAIGGTVAVLLVGNGITSALSANLTIPANVALVVDKGGSVSLGSWDLIVTGPVDAGAYQIFTGTGAVSLTTNGVAYPEWFGAVGNGATEESAVVQKAINCLSAGEVIFSGKTYVVANLQLKSYVNLTGKGATLKLPANAYASSINGSGVDTGGYYANNVIGTTLNHDGGAWYDGGTRAANPNNNTYIVSDIIIRGLIIDGNKGENTLGDLGKNASAMGACISLHQAARVTITECVLKNARLDNICLGYSLHGGSDDCLITNNKIIDGGRTGIAMITGKRNTVVNNTITNVEAKTALDIEANITGEINYRHIISGNYFGGVVALNALAGTMAGTIVTNNVIEPASTAHGIWLQGGDQTAGVVISNNRMLGSGAGSAAFNILGGLNTTGVPLEISGNIVSGFESITTGSILSCNYVTITGNTFNTKYGFQLMRPYKVEISNNDIILAGGAGTLPAFYILFGQVTSVPNQGEILIHGNKVRGTGISCLIDGNVGTDPPTVDENYIVFEDNDMNATVSGTYSIDLENEVTMLNNRITLAKTMNWGGSSGGSKFIGNTFIGVGARFNLFINPAQCKRITFSNNKLIGVNLTLYRPQYCFVTGNIVRNGKLLIIYSYTSGGIGQNLYSGNSFIADSTIDNAFELAVGDFYSATDFSGNDIIMGNTHAGAYTTGAKLDTTGHYTSNYNSF